jgi:hypothetical protein
VGEGLETSTTQIVVIYSQKDFQAEIELGLTMNDLSIVTCVTEWKNKQTNKQTNRPVT